MRFFSRQALCSLGFSMLLAACGGGDDGGGGSASADRPTARISASATTANAGDSVNFDGTASSAANGGALTYQWNVSRRPVGSVAGLANATAAQTGFQPDLPGSYGISLVVKNASAASNEVEVSLEVTNPNPVAVVVPELVQVLGTTVQLDASASLAPSGAQASDLRFSWTLEEKPAGSQAVLDKPREALPRFDADKEGLYRASVVVMHGDKVSQPAIVRVNINRVNSIPVADAGAAITNAVRGQRVQLNGGASRDADGDALQYHWRFAMGGKPYGSQAELADNHSATPNFVPDFAGTYRLQLRVYDGTALSEVSSVEVQVKKPAGAANTAPVALITRPFNKSFESERGVTLAPTGVYSQDVDADPLTREWTLLSAPDGFDRAANWTGVTFTGTHYGNYVVQLRVFDETEWSAPVTATYTIINGANRPPVARATVMGSASAIAAGSSVNLTAETSTDADGNRMTYAWTLRDRPAGSTATLSNATSMNASFVADKPGPYLFSLIVTDEHGVPSSDGISSYPAELMVMAKARNNPPIARMVPDQLYSQEQPLVIGRTGTQSGYGYDIWNTFDLSGHGYDPDGDSLTYLWTLSREPAGSQLKPPASGAFCSNTGSTTWPGAGTIALAEWLSQGLAQRSWTCSDRLGIAPSVAGSYQMQVAVSDGIAFAGPYSVTLHAVERKDYPSLLLEYVGPSGVSGDLSEQTHPTKQMQQLFPYASVQSASFPLWPYQFQGGVQTVVQQYRLTAYGGDYTIADLVGSAKDAGYALGFEGLSNNQVIRKGQTVDFKLWMQLPATLPSAEVLSAASAGMEWRFRIAEKAGWTFSHKPFIAPW